MYYGADETRNIDLYIACINLHFKSMFDCASITLMVTTLNNIILETGQISKRTLINDKLSRTH